MKLRSGELPETIAIVIAVYQGEETLGRTLDSLSSQTRRPSAVVVMDGGSTDGTQDILASRGDVVTLWRSAKDMGIYDAWNKALAHVTADWVAFLGADDYLHDTNVLARMASAAAAAPPETPFIYGRLHEVDAAGQLVGEHGRPWALCRDRFAFEMNLPHPGMWHRRSACFADGGFDISYRIAGDYAKLRPLLLRHAPLFVDTVVADAQEGGVSTHPDRRVASVQEAGRAILACGQPRPVGWHLMLLKNLLRRAVWRVAGDGGLHRVRAVARRLRGGR